jgi:hypothetical protein
VDEIVKASAKLVMPDAVTPTGSVPDGKGVRLFIKTERSGAPIVEVAAEDWKALALPDNAKEIPAETFKGWLSLLYPPAIRTADQSKPFKTFDGKLTLTCVGEKAGVLRGELKLSKGEGESSFEGTLEAAVTIDGDTPKVAGVIEGVYLYRQRGEQKIKLTAAIESRP